MLKDVHNLLKKCAGELGDDWELLSKTELANGYCDAVEANDEVNRSRYYSAFILKYWNNIYKWQLNSASLGNQPEDFVEWLETAFNIAFGYKLWRYEFEPIVKKDKNKWTFMGWKLDKTGNRIPNKLYYKTDPNAPDKIMNRCLFSVRGMYYQYANKDLRKENYQVDSIDRQIETVGDMALNNLRVVEGPADAGGGIELVHHFLKNNRVIEALILDGIMNGNTTKLEKVVTRNQEKDSQGRDINKKYIRTKELFDKRKLVSHLTHMNEDYINGFFCKQYQLSSAQGEEIFNELKNMSNNKINRRIEKVFIEIRTNKKLLSYLMD